VSNQISDIDKLLGTDSVEKDTLSISKSLITNFWDYEKGDYCGIVLRDIDILKIQESVPSDRMLVGQYFEYLATGQKNRDGSTPGPVLTKSGKPDAMSERMQIHAVSFKRLAAKEKLKIIKTGGVMMHERDGYIIKGVTNLSDQRL